MEETIDDFDDMGIHPAFENKITLNSLQDQCLNFISDRIDYWSDQLTDFHLASCTYILSPFHRFPPAIIQRIIDWLQLVR
jgi:hypothetical protein